MKDGSARAHGGYGQKAQRARVSGLVEHGTKKLTVRGSSVLVEHGKMNLTGRGNSALVEHGKKKLTVRGSSVLVGRRVDEARCTCLKCYERSKNKE